MTVTAVRKNPQALTMTSESEFAASPERVWQLWSDPRQLERWWGPPTYPATVTGHDLRPGGRVEYYMTGPTGDQPRGYWNVIQADPPNAIVFRDGFSNDDGTPNTDLPGTESRSRSRRSEAGGPGCRFSASSPAPRRWSGSWRWAWKRACSRRSARSTRSSRRTPSADEIRPADQSYRLTS